MLKYFIIGGVGISLVFASVLYIKESEIKKLKENVSAEKTSNDILRGSINSLIAASENKDRTINELESAVQLKDKTISDLKFNIDKQKTDIVTMKKKLNDIKTAPEVVKSEYINSALKSIRESKK